jgi:hypothetical protein
MTLIAIAAAFEAITGIVLIADPSFVAWLLLGSALSPAGDAIGRVAGFGLFALGLACRPTRAAGRRSAPTFGLVVYNVLATIFFIYLGIGRELVGALLWPAAAIHAILSVLLVRFFVQPDVSKTT